MLPVGQDIRVMSFTKEQRDTQAVISKRQPLPTGADLKSTRPHFTLKTVESVTNLHGQLDDSCPGSAKTKTGSGPNGSSKTRDGAVDNAEDWQDFEIPLELEWVHPEAPDEIRNIVQESIDEHRALRASRFSATQAIIVRTTITQSRTRDEGAPRNIGSQQHPFDGQIHQCLVKCQVVGVWVLNRLQAWAPVKRTTFQPRSLQPISKEPVQCPKTA